MQATQVWHARRGLSITLAAALLIPLMLVAGLGPAGAAPLGPGVTIYPVGYDAVHLGPNEMPQGVDGEPGFCVQARVYAPDSSDTISSTSTFSDPVLAYIYAVHRFATDDATAAAVGLETHMRGELPGSMAGGNVDVARQLIWDATPQFVKDRASQLVAEAEGAAGPWETAAPASVDGSGTRTGAIHVHPLVGRGGAPLVGYPITVTLNGPATFDETGTNTWSGTTQASTINLAWTAHPGANGEVTWSYAYRNLPRQTLTYVHPSGQRQAQLTYGLRAPSDPEELSAAGPTFRAVGDFRPQGVSSAPASVSAGSSLRDSFVPAAHPGDEWVVLDGKPVPVAYEVTARDVGSTPVPESATAPAGEVVASQVVVAQGPGQRIDVDLGEAPGPSTYVYTWETSEQLQASTPETAGFVDYYRDGWSWTDGTLHEETTIVRYPTEITSSLSTRETINGVMLVDDQWVDILADAGPWSGIPPRWAGDTPTYSNSLYRVPAGEQPTTDSCTPDRTWGNPVTIEANPGFKPSVGDLSWLIPWDVVKSDPGATWVLQHRYTGDARTEAFVSPCEDVTQSFRIPEPTAEPFDLTSTIQSSTLPPVAGDGGSLSDLWTVTGEVPEGAQGRAFLMHRDTEAGDWEPVWTSQFVPLDGPGEYELGEDFVRDGDVDAGWWTFAVEAVHADGVRFFYEPPGHPDQTIEVLPGLRVTTKAQSSSGRPVAGDGGTLSDVHLVTGTVPEGAKGRSTLWLHTSGEAGADGELDWSDAEPVWTSGWVEYTDGPGEYEIPDAFAYGEEFGLYTFDQETVDPDEERVFYEPPGHPDQTIEVLARDADDAAAAADDDVAEALAVTGAQVAALAGLVVLLIGAGAALIAFQRRRIESPAALGTPFKIGGSGPLS